MKSTALEAVRKQKKNGPIFLLTVIGSTYGI